MQSIQDPDDIWAQGRSTIKYFYDSADFLVLLIKAGSDAKMIVIVVAVLKSIDYTGFLWYVCIFGMEDKS